MGDERSEEDQHEQQAAFVEEDVDDIPAVSTTDTVDIKAEV